VADPAYLLDSNILIYLIGDRSRILRDRVEQHEPGALVTSTLCVAEAAYGSRDDPRVGPILDRLLSVIAPLPFDLAAACRLQQIPFRRGRVDRFVAAQALALGLTIVTNNERDFSDIVGLHLENWTRKEDRRRRMTG
jgi:tRNA(fMet)-specific endonuclease VapC